MSGQGGTCGKDLGSRGNMWGQERTCRSRGNIEVRGNMKLGCRISGERGVRNVHVGSGSGVRGKHVPRSR